MEKLTNLLNAKESLDLLITRRFVFCDKALCLIGLEGALTRVPERAVPLFKGSPHL